MRNRFNKFYKPVLLALTSLTLAVCAFFAIFLGVNSSHGGGQFETDTEVTAETVADVTTKTSVALPSISSNSSLPYNGSVQEFRFDYTYGRVRMTDVTYLTFNGATTVMYHYDMATGTTTGTNPFDGDWIMKVTSAGTYRVSFELTDKSSNYWGTDVTDTNTKTVVAYITQANPVVNYTLSSGPYFTEDTELPTITLDEATSTPGTLEWNAGQAPSTVPDTVRYQWNFTPDDEVNYAVRIGYEYIKYQINVIETVTVEWKDEADKVIYTTSSESVVKSKITVTGTYTSGKTEEVTDYTFIGGVGSWGKEGTRYLRVSVPIGDDSGETVTNELPGFEIFVGLRTAIMITYELLVDPDKIYKANETFDNIKKNDLVVTAYYDDGNNEVLSPNAYSLNNADSEHSEELTVGTCTIIISYQNVQAQFDVEVIKAAHDMDGITFDEFNVTYGEEFTVEVSGEIPEGVTVTYLFSGVLSDETTPYPETSDIPTNAGSYTVKAIFNVDENKYETIENLETTLTIAKATAQLSDIQISGWTYGDTVSTPEVTTSVGNISITYYSDYSEEEGLSNEITAPTSLLDFGTYYVKAEVPSDGNIIGSEKITSFTVAKRAITVTIDQAKTYKGEDLATLTATVTEGTIADGNTAGDVYSLTSPADKNVAGIYSVSGNVLNDNYNITFVGGTDAYRIYQTISVGDGALLGGQIDVPAEGEFTLVVTAVEADKVYDGLEGDVRGFIVTLYKTQDGEQVAVTDVPTIVRLAVPAGMQDYKFFSVDSEGATHETEYNAVENGFIEVVYSGAFPMEFVYTAPIIKAPGIPWWVWLIAVLAVIAIIAIIAEVAVRTKKPPRDDTAIIVEQLYNDEELRRILAEHGKRLADLEERDDDGFNDPYEGGYNFG